ncbi:PPOX class F420-dependent oxidoreductase [Lentzea sp. BCCO 10_0061]|uniref:PPOX class F420-dependent oxidoreductase n=1 Tax=Lentzea sokolovensis TaxID=3095429 RepID=A0ABU4VDF2_9PSEU|nr:PPOX class F420-dependent oxidoreductase [Lentzea sp. BCCO 10_0061]MDX8148925.1 PPOX class F420-dependent oxidoreductase [Lentzea sp. BCCO 10_0061]
MSFSEEERAYIADQPLARIATVSPDGQPDATPVTFDFDGTDFYVGGHDPGNTRRARNVRAGQHKVALIIDDLLTRQPWTPRFLRVYGTAELVDRGGQDVLRIRPVTSWSMNLSGAWSPGSRVDNPTRKADHTNNIED